MREPHHGRCEMFVPLVRPPRHAQAHFVQARSVIGGAVRKIHFIALDLLHSDICYVWAYPAADFETSVDDHVHAFAFFDSVPLSVLYDNDCCLVSRVGAERLTGALHDCLPTMYTFLR